MTKPDCGRLMALAAGVAVPVVAYLVGAPLVRGSLRFGGVTPALSFDALPLSPADGRAVVVAELFTSEGCSSCPPADDVLTRLVSSQPLRGVEIVALGEHVDYWDRLGWRDPYSSHAFSVRQSDYQARVFPSSAVYTPQLVVDGHLEAAGSDGAAVGRTIATAARDPKASVTVFVTRLDAIQLEVLISIEIPDALKSRIRLPGEAWIALTEDHLETSVRAGENRGRTLKHSAVVHRLTVVGTVEADAQTFQGTATLPVSGIHDLSHAKLIGVLQERASRKIVGAGSTTLGCCRD